MKFDPNKEMVITCGSTEAMMAAVMSVVNPGEKVVVFSPFYENYGADAILSGADPIYVPLIPPTFAFNSSLEDFPISDLTSQIRRGLIIACWISAAG